MRKILALAVVLAAFGCDNSAPAAGGKAKVGYITNGIDPFWDLPAAGARAAGKEFNVDVEVLNPKDPEDQRRMLQGLLARGINGVAISPVSAANQVDLLNEAAKQCHVITHDSDAPASKRLCFVGTDNYKAGRAAGKLVKEALPEGGKIMIFVGRLEQLNAAQRQLGVIDELADRPLQSLATLKVDPQMGEIKAKNYTIVGTRTDAFDYPKAKANAEDAMASNPDLAGMVGLFAYNAPLCLQAVKAANKVGKIKIVGFDEQDVMLQGIKDGSIYGTISQQPYQYGYHSVRILAGLCRNDKTVLPPTGFLEVELKVVKKDNVDAFWEELKKVLTPAK